MFKYVHHIRFVVRSRDEFVAYMEANFGMEPFKQTDDRDEGHGKEAFYQIGQTELQIDEPAPGSPHAIFLEEHGPGIHHVGWGIDNAQQLAQELMAKGLTLRGSATRAGPEEMATRESGLGYMVINIAHKDTPGIAMQMVEESR